MSNLYSTLKDPHQERRLFRQRIIIIWIAVGILALVLLGRLVYLQLYCHQVYITLARQNLLNLLPAEPNRGLIYDRNGVLLAENRPVFNLVVTPSRVPDLKVTLTELQKIIPITTEDLQQFNRQLNLKRKFAPLILHSKLTEEEVARFSVMQYRFPGVVVQAQMVRYYPLGSNLAEVVGYVGRINAKELATVDPGNYSATNFIGKTGIEKYYESVLHGTVGYQQAETDASGKVLRIVNNNPPIAGNNLYLTIDSRLQTTIRQILGAQRGAVVAINPQNGEVLAFVSNPSYDPNLFVTGISKKDYQALATDPQQPLYNRALHGRFPPASTVKPFIGLEGLTSGIVTPSYSIYDPGWFQLKNSSHQYRDWRRKGHGTVNLTTAIAQSCDTYFYNLANKLGIDRIATILTQFGFGKLTGIDLDQEVTGLVPTPDWKQRVQHLSWYPGDTLITGIGQGFLLATPLQLATATATLAMHGMRLQPHLLLKSIAPNRPMIAVKPTALPNIVLNEQYWNLVIKAMESVAKSPQGTAYSYFLKTPYTLAAKSGTAQVFSLKKNQHDKANLLPEKLRDNALFITFAPVEHPQIAMAIMLQNNGSHAAIIARQILDAYFLRKS